MRDLKKKITTEMLWGKRPWPVEDHLFMKNYDYKEPSGFPKFGYVTEPATKENPNITVNYDDGSGSATYIDVNSAIQDGWEVD